MKNFFKYQIGLTLAVLLFVGASCRKDKPVVDEEPPTTFPKQNMLVNMADNVILPCYSQFKISLDSLSASYAILSANPSQANLDALRKKLYVAYLRYQRISLFGFGPGEDESIRSNFNVFPTDTAQINNNIRSGTYILGAAANVDAKGFPALEYLFHVGLDQNGNVQNLDPLNFKKYVNDLLNEMSDKTNKVINSWIVYRSTFVNSLGTDISSSIGFLINQLNYELDYLKNAKFGIPLGLKSDGQLLPHHSESIYAGNSVAYATETLKIIENIYRGRSFAGVDGPGFDDYIVHLGSKRLEEGLNVAIDNQFALTYSKLALLNAPIHQMVVTDQPAVYNVYKELVKLLVLLKTDLPSSLGVVITYQDGDGD